MVAMGCDFVTFVFFFLHLRWVVVATLAVVAGGVVVVEKWFVWIFIILISSLYYFKLTEK